MPVYFQGNLGDGSPKLDNRMWIKPFKVLKDFILDKLNEILPSNANYQEFLTAVSELNERFATDNIDLSTDFYYILDLFFNIDPFNLGVNDTFYAILNGNNAGIKFVDYLDNPLLRTNFTYNGFGQYLTNLYGGEGLYTAGDNESLLQLTGSFGLRKINYFFKREYNREEIKQDIEKPDLKVNAQSLLVALSTVHFYFQLDEIYLIQNTPEQVFPSGKDGQFCLKVFNIENKKVFLMVRIKEFGFYPSFLHSTSFAILDKYNMFMYPTERAFNEDALKDMSPQPVAYPKYFMVFHNIKKPNEFPQKLHTESNIYVWNDDLFYVHFKRHIIRFTRQGDKFVISKVWKIFNDNYIRIQNFHTLVYMLENKQFETLYDLKNPPDNPDIIMLIGTKEDAENYLREYYDIITPPE